jgi:hypothetical protein
MVRLIEENKKMDGLGGFLVQTRELLAQLGLSEYWGVGNFPKKAKWREVVKNKVLERDMEEWRRWRVGKRLKRDWLVASKERWGQADYVQRVKKTDRQLLAAVRLQSTRAGRGGGKDDPLLKCRFCGLGVDETIAHLVLSCPQWSGERRRIVGPGSCSQSSKWLRLTCGSSLSIAFLRVIRDRFRETTGGGLVPWVAVLGTGGSGGLELVVMEVAKWLGSSSKG